MATTIRIKPAEKAGAGGGSGYGSSGYSGISGYSGLDGAAVGSGYSGISGYSGFSGVSGYSGISGYSGRSGYSGVSGYSGTAGLSGYSGTVGATGLSGYSGSVGLTGTSGYSGSVGAAGSVGASGYSGLSGYSGYSGMTGSTADASEGTKGIAELATQTETDAGTDDARIVTPKKLKESSHLALVSTSAKGLVPTAPDKVYQALRGNGNWGGIPYVLYKSTTTVSISNSNSETTIFSVTVPANMLGTHNMVRVTILGGIVKNAAGVSGIHTWRLKYGSTTVNTWTSPEAGQDSASQYSYKYEGHLFPANGSTSQQRGSWTNCLSRWWTGSNAIMSALVDSPAGENSTQNKTLSVTFQFNQANANIQFYVYMVLVEVLQ